MEQPPHLTNVQRELLELFALEVPQEDLHAIKKMMARYFAEKASDEMDCFVAQHGLSPDDLKRWAHEHERAAADRP
jgi:hypothetical protein